MTTFRAGDPVLLKEDYDEPGPGAYVVVLCDDDVDVTVIRRRDDATWSWTVMTGDLELDAAAVMDQVMREVWG